MLWQAISFQIDGGGSSETAVATFNGIAILTPRCLQVDTAGLPEMLAGREAGNWLWSYLPDVLMSVSRGGDEVRRRCGEGSAPGNMS